MDKRSVILMGMAPAAMDLHGPVQVQKLFFLIDRNMAEIIGGPVFNFQPYNYGPFDKAVYETLEALVQDGLVEIVPERSWKSYRLTSAGQSEGEKLLAGIPDPYKAYVVNLSHFVRSLSFSQLVSAIYKQYPEMRANSVFQE
jgi:hypothetical protein